VPCRCEIQVVWNLTWVSSCAVSSADAQPKVAITKAKVPTDAKPEHEREPGTAKAPHGCHLKASSEVRIEALFQLDTQPS
jgi:hypothetical protein